MFRWRFLYSSIERDALLSHGIDGDSDVDLDHETTREKFSVCFLYILYRLI